MHRSLGTFAFCALSLAYCEVARAETPPEQPCFDDDDCFGPSSPYCDPQSGDCVPCVVDDHCELDFVCHQNACIPKCFSDADCDAPESHCSDEGVCLECLEDAHCPGDEPLCLSEPGVGECVECIIDEDCSEPTPWCKWSNTCVECLEQTDCPEDEHCLQDVCMPDICEPDALSCSDDQLWVHKCNEWGFATTPVEQCPNADCEEGVCGGPASSEGTGSETSGGTMGETGDPGATPGSRGCDCSLEGESAPVGALGLVLATLFGIRGRRRR